MHTKLFDSYERASCEHAEARHDLEVARDDERAALTRLDNLQERVREVLRLLPNRQLYHDGYLYQLKTSPGSGDEQFFRSPCATAEGLDADDSLAAFENALEDTRVGFIDVEVPAEANGALDRVLAS